jgi:hypothetical protein
MKRNNEKSGMVQWLINHKILVCIFLGVLYWGYICVFGWIGRNDSKLIEELGYVSQIISGFFVIIGTVIAVAQYVSNSNIARNEADKQRKMEAARMADEFRKNVIPMISRLSIAFTSDKLQKEVIEYLDNAKLVHFDKDEVERLFPEKRYMQLRALVAQHFLLRTSDEFRKLTNKYKNDKDITIEERKELSEQMTQYVFEATMELGALSMELSNSLEYMCICFNTNIADDETVYQSLHAVFFKAVHMIYIFTFDANENEYDRLFYNIMLLYKKWKKINQEKKLEEENDKEKLEEEMNSLKTLYHEKITVRTQCE